MHNISIAINPNKIFVLLLSVNTLFTLLYVGHYLVFNYAPAQVFDLDAETNIPTWYSSAQLLMISLALLSIYYAQPKNVFYKTVTLLLGSIVFLFLSIDEVAQLHEKLNSTAFGTWISLYIAVCFAILLILRKEIVCLCRSNHKALCLGLVGAILYLIAMSSEYVGFYFYGDTYWSKAEKPLGYIVEVAFEELLEMTGHSVILYGVMQLFSNEGTRN